jgi:hypothetical protein
VICIYFSNPSGPGRTPEGKEIFHLPPSRLALRISLASVLILRHTAPSLGPKQLMVKPRLEGGGGKGDAGLPSLLT